MGMTISRAASRSGCTPPTIRFYESIGLIAAAARTPKGHRVYENEDVSRLSFIRRARDFGLPIEQVRELLAASRGDGNGCEPASAVIQAHLKDIRARRAELRLLETELQSMLTRCNETCGADKDDDADDVAACSIFEDIKSRPRRGGSA